MAYSPYSPQPSPSLQGSLASPVGWRSTDQQHRTGLIAPRRQPASVSAGSTHLGYSGYPQARAFDFDVPNQFRPGYPQARAGSGMAGSFKSVVRPPPAGALSVSIGHASPSLVKSQAAQLWPTSAGSSTPMGLTNTRYAKVLDSTQREGGTRVPQSPSVPLRSIGNTLNGVSPPSPNVMRQVGSPSAAPYQGLSLQSGSLAAKAPPRIISSFQVGVEPSRSHGGCGGVSSQPRALGQLVPQSNSRHGTGRMDYAIGSGRTPAYASSALPASPQAMKFRWPGPEVRPLGAPAPVVLAKRACESPQRPAPVVLAKRACESPQRGQQVWSPSTLDARSIPTTSPSPIPTEHPEVQSSLPPLSHRTTSPAPPEVQLCGEESAQEHPMMQDRVDSLVDAELIASLDVANENKIPGEMLSEDCSFHMVQQSTLCANSNIGSSDTEVVKNAIASNDGGWQVTDRQADEFAPAIDYNVEEAYVQPETDDIILDEGLAPAPDEEQYLVDPEGSDLSWAVASDRHPLVSEEEASYIIDCLQSIRDSFASNGYGQVALAEGICTSYEAVASLDPNDVVRILLERLLQTCSRHGADDIFVMPGTVYSTGYKKKLPLHVFPGDCTVPLSEQQLLAKPATMTVIWPWDVKLEPDAQYAQDS